MALLNTLLHVEFTFGVERLTSFEKCPRCIVHGERLYQLPCGGKHWSTVKLYKGQPCAIVSDEQFQRCMDTGKQSDRLNQKLPHADWLLESPAGNADLSWKSVACDWLVLIV